MKLNIKKLQNLQRPLTIFGALLLSSFVFGHFVYAVDWMGYAADGLAAIINLLTSGIGWILVFFFKILLGVAQFTTFVDAGVVKTGWPIVRDICNMFFILALLIIAFSTILGINNNWKKELPKLLMAAILINFSKTIAGLMIDASQIFLLTFINAVAAAGAGNFAIIFDVGKYSSLAEVGTKTITETATSAKTATTKLSLLAGTIAAFAAVLITTVITVVLIAAFVMRIVKLWAYLILSPLPYLLSCFSGGKSYANQWWSEFSKELIGGPVLAFFLWLALTIGANSSDYTTYSGSVLSGQDNITSLFSDGPFQRYIMVVAFLVLGLQMAAKAGGTMGEWAGKGSKWVNSGAAFAKKQSMRPVNSATNKLKDITYISAAQDYMKMRGAQKDSARADANKAKSYQLAGGIASIKENTVGRVGKMVDSRWQKFGGGAEAKKLRGEVDGYNKEISALEAGEGDKYAEVVAKNFTGGTPINHQGKVYSKDASGNWREFDTHTASFSNISSDDIKKSDGFKEAVSKDNNIKAWAATEKTRITSDRDNKEANADIASRRQKAFDNFASVAAPVVNIAGLALGGLPGLMGAALGTTLAGGKDAGGDEKKLVSKYRNEQITDKRGKMKDDSNSEVRSVLKDSTKDGFTRMAALMEGISRGVLSENEVTKAKSELQANSALGGAKANGDWNDKKLNSNFVNLQQSKMRGLDAEIANAKAGDASAKDDVRTGYQDGTYKMNNMDIDSLKDSIDQLVDGMSNGSFVKQMENMTSGKFHALTDALISNGKEQALIKLALVDFKKGVAKLPPGGMAGATKQLTAANMKEIFNNDDAEQGRALATEIKNIINAGNFSTLHESSQEYLTNKAGRNMVARHGITVPGIPTP